MYNNKNNNVRNNKDTGLYTNRVWLEGQYVLMNKSAKEISEMCGVPVGTIIRNIERFNLEHEPNTEEQQAEKYFETVSEPKKVKKVKKKGSWGSTPHTKPKTQKYKSKTVLKRMFYDENMPIFQMAKQFGVSEAVVRYWLKKYGLTKSGKAVYRTRKEDRFLLAQQQTIPKTIQVNPYSKSTPNITTKNRKAYSTIRNYETGLYDVVGVIEHEHGYHNLEHGMFLDLTKEVASELAVNMNRTMGLKDAEANKIILSSLGWDKKVRQ
jgi:transposase